MSRFKPGQNYFRFKNKVLNGQRYFFDEEVRSFLNAIKDSAREREIIFEKEKVLWRAQKAFEKTEGEEQEGLFDFQINSYVVPVSPERMTPRNHKAKEGRINPKGISYLYLCTDKDTAMAEVRPYLGSRITISQFALERELKLVDCSATVKERKGNINIGPRINFKDNPTTKEIKKTVWANIETAFSYPVERNDDTAEYVPTQIISGLFKKEGYDGIKYKSILGEGYNVALFNLDDAKLVSSSLYRTNGLEYSFEELVEPS